MRRRNAVLLLLLAAAPAGALVLLARERPGGDDPALLRREAPGADAGPMLAGEERGMAASGPTLASASPARRANLRSSLAIRGRAWLGDDEPAAGALVTCETDAATRRVVARTTAGPDGSYALEGLDSGFHWVTATLTRGERELSADGLVRGGTQPFDLRLVLRLPRIAVQVVDPYGAPVPWARLRGLSGPVALDLGNVSDGRTRLEIGPSRFGPGLPEVQGWYVEAFDARGPDGRGLPLAPRRVGPLVRGQDTVEIRLEAGTLVEAQVTPPPGLSLDGAQFRITLAASKTAPGKPPPAQPLPSATYAGAVLAGAVPADGRVRCAALDPLAPHTLVLFTNAGTVGNEPVTLLPGAPAAIVQLRATLDAEIRVEGPDGRRLEGVEVHAQPERGAQEHADSVPQRDGDGGATVLIGLDPQATYVLQVRAPEWADPQDRASSAYGYADLLPLRLQGWKPRHETVRLKQGLRLGGVVREHDGTPGAGSWVHVQGAEGLASGAWSSSHSCDEQGRFEVRGLPPGTYALRAEPASAVDQDLSEELAVHASAEAGRRDVVFSLPPHRRAVLEFEPRQLAEATADGHGGFGLRVRRRTPQGWELAGSYHGDEAVERAWVSCLRPDAVYEFIQYTGGGGYWRALLAPGATSARFRHEAGGTIQVTITNADEVGDVRLACIEDSLHPWSGDEEQLARGRFILRGLPEGRYQLTAWGETTSGAGLRASVVAQPGESVTLTLSADASEDR